METKLLRIAELAKSDPKMKFTSLAHLLNEQSLVQCHHELPNKKATGVNGTTKEQYSENLKENIEGLVNRLKSKSYRPVPVRRMYIPKLNSDKKRPLGIPEHEDKVVQKGVTKILNTIYENDFLDCSFGFRPNRNCHDALKILNYYIEKRSVNYIVDVDIKGFFDNVDHTWMMEFLKLRISDPNLLRLGTRGQVRDKGTGLLSQEKNRRRLSPYKPNRAHIINRLDNIIIDGTRKKSDCSIKFKRDKVPVPLSLPLSLVPGL